MLIDVACDDGALCAFEARQRLSRLDDGRCGPFDNIAVIVD